MAINNHEVSEYYTLGSQGGLPPSTWIHSFKNLLLSWSLGLRGPSPQVAIQKNERALKTLEIEKSFLGLDHG